MTGRTRAALTRSKDLQNLCNHLQQPRCLTGLNHIDGQCCDITTIRLVVVGGPRDQRYRDVFAIFFKVGLVDVGPVVIFVWQREFIFDDCDGERLRVNFSSIVLAPDR